MYNHLKTVSGVLFLILFLNSLNFAQPYGQLFTKQEADEKFGPVIQSFAFQKPTFQNFLSKTNNYIMFRVEANKVIILDNKRNVLFPEGRTVNSSDTFSMYSLSVVQELLLKANENVVFVEQRGEVLTLTFGGYTMELSVRCPPICD